MTDSPTIDNADTRAICEEIGERLRILLKPAADETADFDDRLDRLSAQQDEGDGQP